MANKKAEKLDFLDILREETEIFRKRLEERCKDVGEQCSLLGTLAKTKDLELEEASN